jgi:hypothetical protein
MTNTDKSEIRGITSAMLKTFIVGSVAVCGSIIGSAVYVKSTLVEHTNDISALKESDKLQSTQLTDLLQFKAKAEVYFDKPKKIKIATQED